MPGSLQHRSAIVSSVLASTLGAWRGVLVVHRAAQPALPITLYDYEACPFCRRVREVLSALHLDVQIKPCPRNGQRFRPEALRIGGKHQFPLLVDPNTRTSMYESRDIIAYLFRTYGAGGVPVYYRAQPLGILQGMLASAARLGRGARARASIAPDKPLHLWSFEASPFSRLVREHLTELELPYILHNLGKEHWKELGTSMLRSRYVPDEGGKRHAFWQTYGRVQVPFLQDPNTGAEHFESAAIIAYLERTYARPA